MAKNDVRGGTSEAAAAAVPAASPACISAGPPRNALHCNALLATRPD